TPPRRRPRGGEEGRARRGGSPRGAAGAAGGLALVGTAAAASREPPRPTAPPREGPLPPVAAKAVATVGFTAPPRPVALESPELTIDLSVSGPCWVEATADGVARVHRLMGAGDRATVKAQHEVTLRAGDPAALDFSLNGAPGRRLGEAGRAVTVHISAENYRAFLAR